MLKAWQERQMFNVTEQRLVDQGNQIRKKKWLSDLEMEEIQREVEEGECLEAGETLEAVDQEQANEESSRGECNVKAREQIEQEIDGQSVHADEKLHLVEGCEVSTEEGSIIEKMENILTKEKVRLPPLRGVDRDKVKKAVQKVNAVLAKLVPKDISATNDLLYAGAAVVTEIVGMKKVVTNNKKEPWWKRRLEKQVRELNIDLGRVNTLIQSGQIKRKYKDDLERRYKTRQKGLRTIREEIKQRIAAKIGKIKRYSNRVNQYHQNRVFQNNQKRFFNELNGDGEQQENEAPDAKEAKEFWSAIWSNEAQHNRDAKWLKDFKKEFYQEEGQEKIEITTEKIRKMLQKLPKWKAPGLDMVQGFWFKNFRRMHIHLKSNLSSCLIEGKVPSWMTKGRAVLIQKDKAKGKEASNYRPVTCLPIAWKILTGILAEEIYGFMEKKTMLPEEQKGGRKGSMLYIDRMIMKEVKARKRSIAVAWIDYRKAYDMVPHSWIVECLESIGINEEVIVFMKECMKSWRVELTSGSDVLGEVKINRGIFQGDSLSPLLFVIALLPLTAILKKAKPGYKFASGEKINHLLFMDDLKLYGESEKALDSLVQTVRIFTSDIRMEFGIEKCATLIQKRGKVVRSDGFKLPDDKVINSLQDKDGYKYLGILQVDKVKGQEMKEKIAKEYKRRVRKVLETKLNGENMIKSINIWAVSLVRYSAAFLDWTKEEKQDIDRKTRKLITMHKGLHPKSNANRLYIPRKVGGRGLLSIEDTVDLARLGLKSYVRSSSERLLVAARQIEDCQGESVKDFTNRKKIERQQEWKNKTLHGQFLR